MKRFLHEVETNVAKSVFQDYSDGEKQTSAMFGRSGVFLAPKHSDFVSRFILQSAKADSTILDCFGGSGSTAHAVINLNRNDRGRRKYILAEVAEYFDAILKPRVLKAAYSRDWRAGKPVSREGVSQCIKIIRLESYEDTLNNLALRRPGVVQSLLDGSPTVREDYMLHYMLDLETRDSASLLNVEQFEEPFSYRLSITQGGESRPVVADLVETFNWLLGLKVEKVRNVYDYQTIEGTNPKGERVLVIWRRLSDPKCDDEGLKRFFVEQGYAARPEESVLDRVYVNGDCSLATLRGGTDRWEVLLTEEVFKHLMFETTPGGDLL